MEGYVSVKDKAIEWGLSERNVRLLCQTGKIKNVSKFGNAWAIPIDARKPTDKRETTGEYKNWRHMRRKQDGIN